MSDWSEVARLAISTVVPAASGLLGVGLGAWMVTRRERWRLKLDLYVDLAAAFQQVRAAYRRMEVLLEQGLPTPDADALVKRLEEQLEPEFREARSALHRATAVGRLALGVEAREVIDRYETEDAEAAATPGLFPSVQARRETVERSLHRVEAAARAELRMN